MYTRLEVFLWKEMMGVSITGHAATTAREEGGRIDYLREAELDRGVVVLNARLLDRLGKHAGATEVRLRGKESVNLGLCMYAGGNRHTHSDTSPELGVDTREVLAALDGLAHAPVDRLPVRAAEHRARAEEREGVVLRARVVDGDVNLQYSS